MLPSQRNLLHWLAKNEKYMVVRTDKNLGPAIIERSVYIQRAFSDHLLDATTYRRFSKKEAIGRMKVIRKLVEKFIKKYTQPRLERNRVPGVKYLNKHETAFLERSIIPAVNPKTGMTVPDIESSPRFYITFKVHKTPWKTRPIVSTSGSLLHGLGRWVDRQLQPICKRLNSFLRSSLDLRAIFDDEQPLPATTKLFTCDAVSMYTNIDTDHALQEIEHFLRNHEICTELEVYPATIMEALKLIMKHNLFQFGDTY